MPNSLGSAVANLASMDAATREKAAAEVYALGRDQATRAVRGWWSNGILASLLRAPDPAITVGLAVPPQPFAAIRAANGSPRLADVPADQDALEFELHFAEGASLDILTSKEPSGAGAIARYLAKFGHGIQQVELRCENVDEATLILRDSFGIAPVYPATRPGADGTRINFFLVADPDGGKVLIELYEPRTSAHRSPITGH